MRILRQSLPPLALWPLMLAIPFAFVPRVLPGDTQPWLIIGVVIAFLFYQPQWRFRKIDLALMALCSAAVTAYVWRSGLSMGSLRFFYILLTFLLLWMVLPRVPRAVITQVMRLTVTIWFLIGLYQTATLFFELPGLFPGRYMPGRGGVSSLATEPSAYGGISVLIFMYLLSRKDQTDKWFLCMAAGSILMSGSLTAMIASIFPFLLMTWRGRQLWVVANLCWIIFSFWAGIGIGARMSGLVAAPSMQELPLTQRVIRAAKKVLSDPSINLRSGLVAAPSMQELPLTQRVIRAAKKVLSDPSINLRSGHLYFTCVYNLLPSMVLVSRIDFKNDYNSFADRNDIFIHTGSDFILPIAGEMIYGAGIFGLAILVLILLQSQSAISGTKARIIKVLTVLFFLLNPISIANIFLMTYVLHGGEA